MPVSQVAGGLAFRAQTATSVIVAPGHVNPGFRLCSPGIDDAP